MKEKRYVKIGELYKAKKICFLFKKTEWNETDEYIAKLNKDDTVMILEEIPGGYGVNWSLIKVLYENKVGWCYSDELELTPIS